MKMQVTFWKECFTPDGVKQLLDRLRRLASKGEGYWYIEKPRYIRAYITEADYEWLMDNMLTYGSEHEL